MLCACPLSPKDLFKGHGTFWLRRLTLCLEVGVGVQLQHRSVPVGVSSPSSQTSCPWFGRCWKR